MASNPSPTASAKDSQVIKTPKPEIRKLTGKNYRRFDKKNYGRVVEEVDPFVFEDTFCVISRKYGKNFVSRFSASKSLYLFGPLNILRKLCIAVVTHQLFDLLIILTIFSNCIALGFDTNMLEEDPNKPGHYTTHVFELPKQIEWTFLLIYTFEMIIKILAKGFVVNKFSYLRNTWNVLDFLVVISGYFLLLTDINELDFLKAFRVLRAIKPISILPGLKMMINALMHGLQQLLEVIVFTGFCLWILTFLTLELFMGKLHQVCVLEQGGEKAKEIYQNPLLEPPTSGGNHHYEMKQWATNRQNWLKRVYPKEEFLTCGMPGVYGRSCPAGYICTEDLAPNPDDGWTSFDSFFIAMLTTFQLITLDYWERIYDLVFSVAGPWCIPFFVVVVFFGSFYLLNLMLAVVTMSYQNEARSWELKPLTKHQKLALHRCHSTFSFSEPSRLRVTPMKKYVKRTPEERQKLAKKMHNRNVQIDQSGGEGHQTAAAGALTDAIMNLLGKRIGGTAAAANATTHLPGPDEGKVNDEVVSKAGSHHNVDEHGRRGSTVTTTKGHALKTSNSLRSVAEQRSSFFIVTRNRSMASTASHNIDPLAEEPNETEEPTEEIEDEHIQKSKLEEFKDGGPGQPKRFVVPKHPKYSKLRRRMDRLVHHHAFENFITICIICNTVLMASEHYGQPEWLTHLIEFSSHIFTVVFVFECTAKIIAMHREYFRHYWNLFDLLIVIVSVGDTVYDLSKTTSTNNAASSYQVIRLLRVFKLAQSWLTMKVLLNIIFSSFGALGNLTLILIIFIYIFSVLGMEFVGYTYTPQAFGAANPEDEKFPRWNFLNFWHAFMLIFRVMCGEWIEPLWDCLKAHERIGGGYKCFLIFIPVMVIGNFVILNLFLALLLNSFSTEELKAQKEKEKEISGKVDHMKKVVAVLMTKPGDKNAANKDKDKDADGQPPAAEPNFPDTSDAGSGPANNVKLSMFKQRSPSQD